MVLPIISFSSTEATDRPQKYHKTAKKGEVVNLFNIFFQASERNFDQQTSSDHEYRHSYPIKC